MCMIESDCGPIDKSFISDDSWTVEIGSEM